MLKLSDIRIRDPFILPVVSEKTYYLYGTTDTNTWSGSGVGFFAYRSLDLENWEGPYQVFEPPVGFWADENFWAPEVFIYQGKYIMIASFKGKGICRGVQTLGSESPMGPFLPCTDGPVTPASWECLDGTLYVEEGTPWLVFSHEWTQIIDGEICAVPLSVDLKEMIGEVRVLFRATSAKWVRKNSGTITNEAGESGYVTDGPFLYKNVDGKLCMIWSSYTKDSYAIGEAVSSNGKITGKWIQGERPIYEKDGGHGMIFETFDGRRCLVFHSPNDFPNERTVLIEDYLYSNG